MTARETERLAVVETKVSTVQSDITEMKEDIKTILATLNSQSNKFVTKASARWLVGIAAVVIGPLAGAAIARLFT